MDVKSSVGAVMYEPKCTPVMGSEARVLTLLESVAGPQLLHYTGEEGLKEVCLCLSNSVLVVSQ